MKHKLFGTITNTLRGRLSLWYLFSVGIIILLFLLAFGGLFWITLQDQIDHHIHIAVTEAHQIVQQYHGDERNTFIRNLVSAQGMTVVVLSPDGAPVLETNSPDVAFVTEHQLQKILTSTSLYESAPVHFTENNIRFAALPVQVSGGKGIVSVGYSTRVLYDTFYKMVGIVLSVVIFLVLPITYIGYKFLKRQLHPLERIAIQAKSVTNTTSLFQRIDLQSATEELQDIQEAFNTMLTQLEMIFTGEREFFSDAAHTLKTPLAVLRSHLENSTYTQKSRQELIKTIDSTNDTIQDLLTLSQIGGTPKNIETFSLTHAMADLCELATVLGEENNVKVVSDIQPNIFLEADKKLIQRALGNIVHNAVIYNKPGGTVSLLLRKQSHRITISIKDTGIGISKRDMPHVFTRFFRGSNADGYSSGLGLAISKAVVENYKGNLFLESWIHKGTEVTIRF